MKLLQSVFLALSFVAAVLTGRATVYFQNDGIQEEGWTPGQVPQALGTVTDVTSPAFQGNTAIKFTQTWIPNYTGRYHSEVHYQGTEFTGQTRYYGMTVFLPSNWDTADSKVSIQQWAGTGPWIIMEVRGTNLVILPHVAGITTIAPITPGQWMRIVTQITDTASGSLTVWVNGVQKLHLTGNLVAPAPNGEIRWSCGEYVTGWTGVTTQPSPSYRELFEDHFRFADTEAEAEPANWNETSGPLPVADPVFSPGGGTYTSAQTVSISSATSGALFRYTTDGSTPSETVGTSYSSPVPISTTTTLEAIAYEAGFTDSAVTSATYTISPPPQQVAAPTFSPGGGTYTSMQSVTISSVTSGALFRYTTDGSTPSETAGIMYSVPVSVSATTTLKAIAYEAGFTDSTVTSATYTFSPPPTFNFEAASMSPVGTGATVSTSSDTNVTGGLLEFLNSTAVGQSMTLTTPSIPAGTYQVQFRYKTNTSRAQHNVKIDGTQVGGTIDQYATTQTYPTATLGTVTFATAGTHKIVLTVTAKDSAATKYYITADKFTFVGQ